MFLSLTFCLSSPSFLLQQWFIDQWIPYTLTIHVICKITWFSQSKINMAEQEIGYVWILSLVRMVSSLKSPHSYTMMINTIILFLYWHHINTVVLNSKENYGFQKIRAWKNWGVSHSPNCVQNLNFLK